jgi:putative transposase
MYLSVPPRYSPAEVMKRIKGKSAEVLMKRRPELRKKYWGQHVWARGHFVTTGGVEDSVTKKYIEEQEEEEAKAEQLRLWSD